MGLNREQYVAAHHMKGPMLVLAGPGSGKTHLLVERIRIMIEEGGIPPDKILVITFSKKAARQMQARFYKNVNDRSYPVTFGTFHAIFYRIIKEEEPSANRLITEEEQKKFIELSVKECSLCSELFTKSENTDIVIGLIGAYKNFKDRMYARNEQAKDMTEEERGEFEKLLACYEGKCRDAGLIDFDDMILLCWQLLYKHEWVLRKWQAKYEYILIDEFQDINEAQYNVLRLLAGDERNVFAVGDDDQSIYAFRGACPELMRKFLHQYIGCRRVTLKTNYRCCQNIIGAADTVIRHNIKRLERPMQKHLPSKTGGHVEIVNSESTDVQAEFVCDMIESLMRDHGYSQRDFAVLYRSEHCGAMFEMRAEERGFALKHEEGRKRISKKQLIHEAYVRAHNNTASRADYFLIMNNPERGLSREALCPDIGNYIGSFKSYYANEPEMLERVYNLENMIRNRTWSDEYGGGTSDNLSKNGVNVMTAHASKGLEFKVVFIIGLQEGLFPHIKSIEEPLVQEERRLMYVAMTRAIERLYMCTVSMEHGKRPSRFAGEATEKMQYINDILKLKRC